MRTPTAFLMLWAMLALSCSRGPLFEASHAMPAENWQRFETQWFEFTPGMQNKPCQIELIITYRETVPFKVLQVMGTIHAPSGEQRFREYDIPLLDADGFPLGGVVEGGAAGNRLYEVRSMIRRDFLFSEEGTYKVEIENLMSKYDNPGIVSIGVKVVRE